MTNSKNFFQTIKSIILSFTLLLFPLFFLPTTQELFLTNKLYLLSSGAILLLLVSSIEIIVTKKIRFYKRWDDVLLFFFVFAIFTSLLVTSDNRVQAILNPNFGFLPILTLIIISFYLRGNQFIITRTIPLSGAILSVIAIFFFLKPSSFFSPIGNQLDLVVFLGFCLVLQLVEFISHLLQFSQLGRLFNKIAFAITLAGFIISLNSLLATGFSDLPPFRYSWNSALQVFKNPTSAIFGVGIDNYSSVFTRVKDPVYNLSKLWQISSSNLSSSTLLHILTESGLFGLISFVLYFIFSSIESIKRHKIILLIIVYLTFVFLILPPSLRLFFIFYSVLSGGASGKASTLIEINLKRSPFLYLIPFFMIILITIGSYFLGRSYLAEYYFKKSLDAFAKKNNVKDIYDNQRLAIISNPYIERFRISFSQTNLLIANNIAAKTPTPEVGKERRDGKSSGVNELSPPDRQTMIQAIQASIEEAKAAVKLNDQKAANWENLAVVYRNLINTVQGADTWTISSYQRAIVLDPQNPTYRLNLGGVYFMMGKYDEANRFFEQAVTLKPDWPNAHYNLAWTFFQKKDYQRAISEMQTVINLLNLRKDSADYAKAQKDLAEFKLKLSEESSPK